MRGVCCIPEPAVAAMVVAGSLPRKREQVKILVAALLPALLIASPAMAKAKAHNACEASHVLTTALQDIHQRVPDVQAHSIKDPAFVARGAKIINDRPPATHDIGNEIVVVASPSQEHAFVLLVNHGCITAGMALSPDELVNFINQIAHPGTPVLDPNLSV